MYVDMVGVNKSYLMKVWANKLFCHGKKYFKLCVIKHSSYLQTDNFRLVFCRQDGSHSHSESGGECYKVTPGDKSSWTLWCILVYCQMSYGKQASNITKKLEKQNYELISVGDQQSFRTM